MDKIMAIIPAAGQGKRMGGSLNKQFMILQGMPVIEHTLRAFTAIEVISGIVIVCAAGEEDYYRTELLPKYSLIKPIEVVAGGRERQDSVYCGLSVAGKNCRYVIIHDGARPLVTADIIFRAVREVKGYGALTAGVPVKDTIKRTDSEGVITETLQRQGLWHIQTPQIFRLDLLMRAHEEAQAVGFYGTDDASLVERLGFPVRVIPGSYENIKITTPEDITVAETILRGRENH